MGGEGDRVRARRERLGMGKAELAREAKVGRHTLAAIEAGEGFRRSTLAKIEQALAELETEFGIHAPPPPSSEQVVEFEIKLPGEPEATIVVRGPNAAEEVEKLLRRLRPGNET